MFNRSRRRGNFLKEDKEVNKTLIFSFSVLLIAIISFTVTFVIYRNYLSRNDDLTEFKMAKLTNNIVENKEETSSASSSIGKSINEVNYEKNTNEIQKIAINTSNMKKENVIVTEVENKNEEVKENKKVEKTETKKEEKIPEPTFKRPVEGEIINKFAKDNLIYSETLEEWVTHNGIDIKADKTTVVKASEKGKIKSIKTDPRYGITIVIEHTNGYQTVYANLLTAEFVKEGEEVSQGQTIGTVGNTASFEIAETPHLHFEIIKNGEYLNPEQYLK